MRTKPVHLLVVPKLLQRNATLRKDVGADWLYALRCFELPEGCYYDAMRPLRLPTWREQNTRWMMKMTTTPKMTTTKTDIKCFASYARNLNYCEDVWFKLLSTNKSSFKPFKQTNVFQKQHHHQNMFDKVWYCLQWSIASKEKSVNAVELGSFVQLIREKSALTQLVPCITLAMPSQYSFR